MTSRRFFDRTMHAVLAPVVLLLAVLVGACGSAPEDKRAAGPRVQPPPGAQKLERLGPAEERLQLVAPPGYAEDAWVADFETRTGCRVTVDTAGDAGQVESLLRTGRYDGAGAPSEGLLQLIADGQVAPVNRALVRGYRDLAEGLIDRPSTTAGGRVYGVPQGRSATLLTYRRDRIPGTLTRSDAVFEPPQLAPYRGATTSPAGHMAIADAAVWLAANREELAITNPYELDDRQFRAALRVLREQREYLGTAWTDADEAAAAFLEQDAVQGLAPQAAVVRMRAQRPPVAIASTLPREGTTGEAVHWVVAARARHPSCMYRWIGHVLSPTVQAEVAERTGDAPANLSACQFTRDRGFCDAVRAADEGYWERVAIRATPMRDCGDERGAVCKTRAEWIAGWRSVAATPTG
jgi:putative spermidine/putrescine transport system substrate-binding protein